jgi:hypothetical protein
MVHINIRANENILAEKNIKYEKVQENVII